MSEHIHAAIVDCEQKIAALTTLVEQLRWTDRSAMRHALKIGFYEGVQASRAKNLDQLWEDSTIRQNFDYRDAKGVMPSEPAHVEPTGSSNANGMRAAAAGVTHPADNTSVVLEPLPDINEVLAAVFTALETDSTRDERRVAFEGLREFFYPSLRHRTEVQLDELRDACATIAQELQDFREQEVTLSRMTGFQYDVLVRWADRLHAMSQPLTPLLGWGDTREKS